MSTLTLVDGQRSFTLQPHAEIAVQGWNLGFPAVREVSEDRSDADGSVDSTAYHGPRAVTMTMTMLGANRLRLLDELRSFCGPAARPYLTITSDLWDQPRRVRLRADQQSSALNVGMGTSRPVQAGWVAPDGVLEAVALSEVTVGPSGLATTGLTYPVTYPVTYPASTSGGPVTVVNAGTAPVCPVVRMYGPATGPVLSVDGQGSLSFPSLTIPAGDYVEVDFRERTVLVNSLPTVSRYGLLDFAAATWWQLQPGSNVVRYAPAAYSGGAAAVVTWRAAWL